jgi:hypothetical protein
MTIKNFKEALEQSGVVKEKIHAIEWSVSSLYSTVVRLDEHHLQILADDFPEILNACRVFGAYQAGDSTFEKVKASKK